MPKADNLPPFCAVVTKSGNLNFLEPSGPLRACNGTALPLYITFTGTFSTKFDSVLLFSSSLQICLVFLITLTVRTPTTVLLKKYSFY